MNSTRQDRGTVLYAVCALLGGVVALYALYLLRAVLLLIYVSTILAIGFSPPVRWLEQRRGRVLRWTVPRWAAILIFYLACIATTIVMLAIILPPLIEQSQQLWLALPKYADMLQAELIHLKWLSPRWTWKELLDKLPGSSLVATGIAVTSLFGALETALGALAAIATVLVLPYYLLVEAEDMQRGLLRAVAPENRRGLARITRDVTLKVGAWLGSQMLVCLSIGVMTSMALWLLGVPYPYVLGLVAGLGELVPVIGPILAAIPAVLTGCTISLNLGLVVAAYFCLQQVIENYFLIPRIMQRRVGVSSVTVIVALLVGTTLLGIVGALLAVPTAAIVQVLLHEYFEGEPA
jgi:predicted PurR-regulated permease PerM